MFHKHLSLVLISTVLGGKNSFKSNSRGSGVKGQIIVQSITIGQVDRF